MLIKSPERRQRPKMTRLAILATAAGVACYYGLTYLLIFILFDVFHIGALEADASGLIALAVVQVVPLISAILLTLWIARAML